MFIKTAYGFYEIMKDMTDNTYTTIYTDNKNRIFKICSFSTMAESMRYIADIVEMMECGDNPEI